MRTGDGSKRKDQQCEDDGVDNVRDQRAYEVDAVEGAEGFGRGRGWYFRGETVPGGGVDEDEASCLKSRGPESA